MVKIHILFISLLILVSSCNFYKRLYKRNSCGEVRAKVNFKLEEVQESFYKVCDTSNVYIYRGEYDKSEDFVNHKFHNFLKFYPKGKIGFFSYKDSISKVELNTCKASYAFYGYKKNKLLIKRFVVSTVNGEYIFSYNFSLKKDTLELVDKEGIKTIYVKSHIPKEWLIYKPDW